MTKPNPLKTIFILCLSLCCLLSNAQVLSQKQMLEDINQLENDLLKIHPGLQFYESSADMPALFETVKSSLPDSLSPTDFLLHIAPLIDSVKCGHTGFNIYTKKTFPLFSKPKFKGLLPLHLGIVENHVLIRRNMTNDTLNILPKTELLQINGEDIHEVLQKLSAINLGSDANNKTGRISYVLKNFRLAYRMFYGERDSFDLKIRQIEKDSIVDVRIAGKTVPEMTETIISRYRINPVGAQALKSIKGMDNAAIFDLNRFTSTKWDPFQWGFRRRMKRIFKTIKKREIEYLIIDVRNNPGGVVDNVFFLQRLLNDEPFVMISEARFNRQYFKSKAKWPHKFVYRFRGARKKKDYIRFRPYSGKKQKPKKKWGYDGNIIVLVNEGSFSAACTFALFTKTTDRGILLGQEAGGSYHIVSAGSSHVSHLRHSDLNVRIPVIRFDYNVNADLQSKLNGVVPDIIVPRNLDDYLNGVDTQMEAAIELIRKYEEGR